MWGPLKPPVRQKQLSAASHATASMPGELIHQGTVQVNSVSTVHWTVSDPINFFLKLCFTRKTSV
jgi:hypothetical protein